jgi:hypothetical protein
MKLGGNVAGKNPTNLPMNSRSALRTMEPVFEPVFLE